jgi:hypothetical protein
MAPSEQVIACYYLLGFSSLLRHHATSWMVMDSIPGNVIKFFNLSDPSSRTMVLGSNKSLTEMSTRNLPGD